MSAITARRPTSRPAAVGASAGGLALALAVALWLAVDAGVEGPAVVPDLVRGGVAAVGLFAVCGYAPARLLTPSSMRADLALLVLPFGAATAGFALAALGFVGAPLGVSLPVVLALGALAALAVLLLRGRAEAAGGARPRWEALLPFAVALIVASIALIPSFRNGYATVVGQNGDAELAVGVAELLQRAGPLEVREDLALDRMPGVWQSKYPIYYALAGVAQLSGLEPYKVFATQMAILLALVSIALFLFARHVLGAGLAASVAVMGIVPLDRILMYVAIHPFHNQIWGMLTLLLVLLFGLAYLRSPGRRAALALALFGVLCAFAYPLVLWMPALLLGCGALVLARSGRARGWLSALRLPRGRRSALIWVPLGLLCLPFLLVGIGGVLEKGFSALAVLAPGSDLTNWRGFDGFLPFPRFFGVPGESVLSHAAAFGVVVLAALGLRSRPREVALPLAALGVVALAVAAYFRARQHGDLFFFKDLAFFAPLALACAIVFLVERAQAAGGGAARGLAVAGLALLAGACVAGARAEIANTYDLLNRDLLELREWSAALPREQSIRIDLPPDGYQLWSRHMLHEHPLSTLRPLTGTIFPYPPRGLKADLVLVGARQPRPAVALGAPLFRNRSYRLYRMEGSVPGPDVSSRRLVDSSSEGLE